MRCGIAPPPGARVVDLLDIWDERAAIREYDGTASRADAEGDAALEVESMFAPLQPRLLWEDS